MTHEPQHSFQQEEDYVLLIANAPRIESYHDMWGKLYTTPYKARGHEHIKELAAAASYIIAVDGGANIAHRYGLTVDHLIGDNDSIMSSVLKEYQNSNVNIVYADRDKNKTDLELALEFVDSQEELRSKPLRITNVLGGRADHELANLGTIARFGYLQPRIYENEMRVIFLDSENPELVIRLQQSEIDPPFSVIALLGEAVVSQTGTKWEQDHVRLRPLDALGVSNHVDRGKGNEAHVIVHEGSVAVFHNTF